MAGTTIQVSASLGRGATAAPVMEAAMIEVDHVSLWYAEKLALKDISMAIPKHRVTAYIGPSGCGKSTLLRCFNRMNDLVDGFRMEGTIQFDGDEVSHADTDAVSLRRRI